MTKNYTQRIEKLRKRRSGDVINESVLTKGFNDTSYADSIKYTLESMTEIDKGYTLRTYEASSNIQRNLKEGLAKLGLGVEFRHQGSVETNTHIKLHSDIDILTFTQNFVTLERPQVATYPYQGDSLKDLADLRANCFTILNNIYTQVDDTNSKAIKVFPTNPKRKVDVVVCSWYNTNLYVQTGNEIHRAVQVYDRDTNSQGKDFPFLHISRVNEKDNYVAGGLKKLIRLLKTLKVDADYKIDLSSFEITSALYDISNNRLLQPLSKQFLLLPVASEQLGRLIDDSNYRDNLRSPNENEYVFRSNNGAVVELKKLKLELDELIQDLKEELNKSYQSFDHEITYS